MIMMNKLEIQRLIDRGKFNEAMQVIETLEKKDDLTPEEQLTWQLFKSQILSKTGETTKGLELADKTLLAAQGRGNQLLIDNLASLAQEHHSFPLLINTLILQARFALIEGNLTGAMPLLDQAEITAEEKGLGKLSEKVSAEKHTLTAQLDTWKILIKKNAPLQKRLERAQTEDYISEILKEFGAELRLEP
ncbi:MAG: hypothetical protein ACFFC7_06485 [Candidatus Hermodarchaeota archaeon]